MRHVAVLIGEMLYDNMFSTGAIRCVMEASKVLSTEWQVTLIGASSDGNSVRTLNERTRLFTTTGNIEDLIGLCKEVDQEVEIELLLCTIDHAIELAVRVRSSLTRNMPIVLWNHQSPSDYENLPGFARNLNQLAKVIVPTSHEANRIRQKWPWADFSIDVVPNGITVRDSKTRTSNQPSNSILFVGRRSVAKGYPVWIAACSRLAEFNSELSFIAVGGLEREVADNQYRIGLLASGRLVELPYCKPSAVWRLIADAGVLVLPTRQDCMPVCILEAMHIGTPVIASKLPNLIELAGGNPPLLRLCNCLSPLLLAKEIESTLSNWMSTQEVTKLAKTAATERYSADRMGAELLRSIEEVTSVGRSVSAE